MLLYDGVIVIPVAEIKVGLAPDPVTVGLLEGAAEDVHVEPLDVRTLPEVPGATRETADVPLPTNTEPEVNVVAPVPPWPTDSAVVKPVNEVISEFAPDAAAPMPDRAVACVVPPVPPFATASDPLTAADWFRATAPNAGVPPEPACKH